MSPKMARAGFGKWCSKTFKTKESSKRLKIQRKLVWDMIVNIVSTRQKQSNTWKYTHKVLMREWGIPVIFAVTKRQESRISSSTNSFAMKAWSSDAKNVTLKVGMFPAYSTTHKACILGRDLSNATSVIVPFSDLEIWEVIQGGGMWRIKKIFRNCILQHPTILMAWETVTHHNMRQQMRHELLTKIPYTLQISVNLLPSVS